MTNPRTGVTALARPADWGPAERTGRVADLSPGLAAHLGVETDETCEIQVPLPASVAAPEALTSSRLRVLSVSQIEQTFGKFRYQDLPDGRVKILGNWVAENIIPVQIPELNRLHNGPIDCHKAIAEQFRSAFAEIERRGLTNRILAWDGMFVPRHKTWNPARTLSAHSWAIAFDINARWNGYGAEPAPKGAPGSIVELVPILERFGFAWGGYFSRGSQDGMHFECCKIL